MAKTHNLGIKVNSVETRFKDPFDNLMLAILLQAAKDCDSTNDSIANEAKEYMKNDGREIWEYLKTRPQNSPENDNALYCNKFKNVPHGTIKRRKRRVRKVV
ncbi:MAG: hypothetical protein IKL46_00150 [Clostridia bacterium]|nr:hypothetical protein [Clostridia bacterium]